MIDVRLIQDILEHPEDFIESQEYFSWERFLRRCWWSIPGILI